MSESDTGVWGLTMPCWLNHGMNIVTSSASAAIADIFWLLLSARQARHTRTGALEYANAGHNPPYVFSPAGHVRALKERGGPMLGVFEGFEYPTRTAQVDPGEGILVFTDGVTEARDRNGQFYEEARLEAYLTAHASQPAEELVRGLHAEEMHFEAGAPRADDITVMGLRRRG